MDKGLPARRQKKKLSEWIQNETACLRLSMVSHTCNPSTWEEKTGGFHTGGQSRL
jgi:hypothetical protein